MEKDRVASIYLAQSAVEVDKRQSVYTRKCSQVRIWLLLRGGVTHGGQAAENSFDLLGLGFGLK